MKEITKLLRKFEKGIVKDRGVDFALPSRQ